MRRVLLAASCLAFLAIISAPLRADDTKPDLVLKGFAGTVRVAAVSTDGKRVLGADNKTVRTFDAVTGKQLAQIDIAGIPDAIRETADGKHLIVAGAGGGLRMFDAQGQFEKDLFPEAKGSTRGAAFNDSVSRVALGVQDGAGTVRMFSLPDGKQLPPVKLPAPPGMIALDKDAALLAATRVNALEANIELWDVKAGRLKSKMTHGKGRVLLCLSADASIMVSALADANSPGAFIWDLKTGKSTTVPDTNGWSTSGILLSPDGKSFLYSYGNDLFTVDIATAKKTGTVAKGKTGTSALAWFPGGKVLLRGQGDTLEIWTLAK